MEESGTKLHIPLVLKYFVLFPQKLSVCGRVSIYLLTVAETHDSSQQPTDFNILPPFIAMWKLYGIVLNEAGAMIGCRPLPKLSFNLLGHLQAFVFSSEMQRYCKSNAKLSCLHEKVVPGYSLSYLKILHL